MLRSLLVGLKSVDPHAYGNWTGENGCWGCELDVDNILRILDPLGYESRLLKTQAATAEAVLSGLSDAAKKCESGDSFVFYFSGHGGQSNDSSHDETDGDDETLVAYNREIIDDELNDIWMKFKPGVRIFMLSDSCNSGTNFKMSGRDVKEGTPLRLFAKTHGGSRRNVRSVMKAQLIHFGGCRDGSTSAGYMGGGAFTQAMCQVWNGGQFSGDYTSFFEAIKQKVTSGQEVQFGKYGPVEESYLKSRPFGGSRSAPDGTQAGNIQTVRCELVITESHLRNVREVIEKESAKVLLSALDDALSQRPWGGSVSCTGSTSGGVSCSGSVTVSGSF